MLIPLRKYLYVCTAILVSALFSPPANAENELSVGSKAGSLTSIDLDINNPQDLSFKSKSEILALRSAMVAKYPQLLSGTYQPDDEVFSRLESDKPWWGLSGEAVWGPGKRSIEGSSEESRFLLNPFMLVAANPYSYNIWDPQKITDNDLSRADFPYTWLPQVVHWSADKSSAEVDYRVSAYNEQLYAWREKLRVQKIMPKFALVAYNARDFGYQWIWLATDRSSNIECLQKPSHATRITQMIHCGGTCGYPGGCNNMSPSIPDIDEIAYTQLPAKACIYLWKEKPADVTQTPDMTVILSLN